MLDDDMLDDDMLMTAKVDARLQTGRNNKKCLSRGIERQKIQIGW